MKSLFLTAHSLRRPWLVVILTLLATLLFALQFPKVKFDNDPENMLGKRNMSGSSITRLRKSTLSTIL
jgi:predicted RND superfamily exporter protein